MRVAGQSEGSHPLVMPACGRAVCCSRRLRRDGTSDETVDAEWAARMLEETREALVHLLPFTAAEQEFLERLLDRGEIEAGLLTEDEELQARIEGQPWLHWKALHVRKHKLD